MIKKISLTKKIHQKKFNLDGKTLIKRLNCRNQNITILDLERNIKLEELDCRDNKITKLDLTKNLYLRKILCDDNIVVILKRGQPNKDLLIKQILNTEIIFID